jgi:hypothetical protein
MKTDLRRRGCEDGEDVRWQSLVLAVLKTLLMLLEMWLSAWLVSWLIAWFTTWLVN